jgi:hypothetical protein
MDERSEGIYCAWETYPALSGLKDNIFTMERVCGDGSVITLSCARSEAREIFNFLAERFKEETL